MTKCSDNTQSVRQRIKLKRKSLSKHQQSVGSLRLFARLLSSRYYKRAKHLGMYLSHQGEIDLKPLIKHALKQRKHVYLPIVSKKYAHNKLSFHPFNQCTHLTKNKFGILEPVTGRYKKHPRHLDLVLAPLVAFDAHCNRLGMGGGYYDRTFGYKQRRAFLKPRLIGVGYDWQRQKNVVPKAWDIPMDRVFTDKHRY